VIDQAFTMIDAGDLDGLKTLTRNIPPKDLVNMRKSGLYSILIYAVDKERRDIVKWLVDEKKADVNLQIRNETPMQRALFRNNELLVKDLIDWGADMNHQMPHTAFNMPLYAIMREKPRLLDMMLAKGASMDYNIDRHHVRALLQMHNPEVEAVHFKHRRWRRLR